MIGSWLAVVVISRDILIITGIAILLFITFRYLGFQLVIRVSNALQKLIRLKPYILTSQGAFVRQ